MRRVTIGAGCGGFEAERGRLPVESIAVTRRLVLMARTAIVNHLQIEITRRKRRGQMRNSRMAGRAARSVLIALPESREMTAGFEIRHNLGMTCRAHRLRVCAAQGRSRIRRGQHIMRAVTIGARGGFSIAFFYQFSVDAVVKGFCCLIVARAAGLR